MHLIYIFVFFSINICIGDFSIALLKAMTKCNLRMRFFLFFLFCDSKADSVLCQGRRQKRHDSQGSQPTDLIVCMREGEKKSDHYKLSQPTLSSILLPLTLPHKCSPIFPKKSTKYEPSSNLWLWKSSTVHHIQLCLCKSQ